LAILLRDDDQFFVHLPMDDGHLAIKKKLRKGAKESIHSALDVNKHG
jgi:hypothetical protein